MNLIDDSVCFHLCKCNTANKNEIGMSFSKFGIFFRFLKSLVSLLAKHRNQQVHDLEKFLEESTKQNGSFMKKHTI